MKALKSDLLIRIKRFRLGDRRGVVAVITAFVAPVLIGFSALAVDVTYWYGTQEALKTATEAAAMKVAILGESNSASPSIGLQAADTATNNQFNFANGGSTYKITVTRSLNASGTPIYTATANGPGPLFFAEAFISKPITIAASAAAAHQFVSPTCVLATNQSAQAAISAVGTGTIDGTNCAVFSDSSATGGSSTDAITVSGSGVVEGTGVGAAGAIYVPPYSGYVGGPNGNGSNVNQFQAIQPDPYADMGNPPPMPTLPQQPSPGTTTDIKHTRESLGYTPIYSDSWGGCGSPAYGANCYIEPGTFTGGIQTNTESFNAYTGAQSSNGESTYSIFGGTSIGNNGYADFGVGTYYMSGPGTSPHTSAEPTGYALTTNIPKFTIEGGTYYVNGGFDFSGSGSEPTTLGQGTYFFQGTGNGENNGGGWALTSNVSNVTFTGGTYFFNGGLNLASYGTITFGPGIYYIANGNLNISGSDNIIVNGATFVLEDGAAFDFTGGSQSLNLQAPSTNCVQPKDYPIASDASNFPYDGTNGEGICGVLIYQARSDTAPDAIDAGATDTVNGAIYAPNAPLSLDGAGSLAPAANGSQPGALSVVASTIAMSGSARLDAAAPPNSPDTQTYANYLVSGN
jgi:Flp pilus assembly protein TadG